MWSSVKSLSKFTFPVSFRASLSLDVSLDLLPGDGIVLEAIELNRLGPRDQRWWGGSWVQGEDVQVGEARDFLRVYQEEELPLNEVGIVQDERIFLDKGLAIPHPGELELPGREIPILLSPDGLHLQRA